MSSSLSAGKAALIEAGVDAVPVSLMFFNLPVANWKSRRVLHERHLFPRRKKNNRKRVLIVSILVTGSGIPPSRT